VQLWLGHPNPAPPAPRTPPTPLNYLKYNKIPENLVSWPVPPLPTLTKIRRTPQISAPLTPLTPAGGPWSQRPFQTTRGCPRSLAFGDRGFRYDAGDNFKPRKNSLKGRFVTRTRLQPGHKPWKRNLRASAPAPPTGESAPLGAFFLNRFILNNLFPLRLEVPHLAKFSIDRLRFI